MITRRMKRLFDVLDAIGILGLVVLMAGAVAQSIAVLLVGLAMFIVAVAIEAVL